jgi:hypothetical protein
MVSQENIRWLKVVGVPEVGNAAFFIRPLKAVIYRG